MRRQRLVVLATICSAALLGLSQSASGSPSATSAVCQPGQPHGSVGSSSGAAGTITLAVVLRNGGSTCTLEGFAGLRLRNANGKLPTRVRRGGLAVFQTAPKLVTLAPNEKATILIAYSDVPSGAETSCPIATKLIVHPPRTVGTVPVNVQIGACSKGRLFESPVLQGVRQAP